MDRISNSELDDILIIKDYITTDPSNQRLYEYTAYIHNGSNWVAMDGNYSAENVYFKNNFTFTESVGAIEVPPETGNVIVEAEGLNIKQFLTKIFSKEEDPIVTYPTLTITATPVITSYEIGSKITQGYTTTYYSGQYQYGPAPTGAVKLSQTIKDSKGNVLDTASGTFPEQVVTDKFEYRLECSATYDDGEVPLTNLGNKCADKQIKAGTTDTIYTGKITSYRNSFYGAVNTKAEILDADYIRNLNASNYTLSKDSTFNIPIPIGTMRVIIAYPASLGELQKVEDSNDSNSNIVSAFGEPEIISIPGANNLYPIDYRVYKTDFAKPYDAINTFKVTI